MTIRDFDPGKPGQCYQGDVSITPVPAGWSLDMSDEVKPVDGRLILQEGEITGHHHAVHFRDDGLARAAEASASEAAAAAIAKARTPVGTARLFRDPSLAARMAGPEGPNTAADLTVGFLLVEGSPVVVRHEEHDGIRLPPGLYEIGRQVESAGAEERRVAD